MWRSMVPRYQKAASPTRLRLIPDTSVGVSTRRAAEDAATVFRRAIAATGVAPTAVATDRATASPPALAAALPGTAHETGERVQRRIARDHRQLKGRVRGMRGVKTRTGAGVRRRAHASLRDVRGHFSDRGCPVGVATAAPLPSVLRAWDAPTADLSGR